MGEARSGVTPTPTTSTLPLGIGVPFEVEPFGSPRFTMLSFHSGS